MATVSPLSAPSAVSASPQYSTEHSLVRSRLLRKHPFLADLPECSDACDLSRAKSVNYPHGPAVRSPLAQGKEDGVIEQVAPVSKPHPVAFGPTYVPDEQTLRPDHPWNYSASGFKDLTADAVRNRGLDGRFSEYPKLRRLLDIKRKLVDESASPATYIGADLRDSLGPPPGNAQRIDPSASGAPFHLASLMPVKFDVVLIDAPLSCYEWDSLPSATTSLQDQTWSWEDLEELPIPLLTAKESLVFLWVGPGCSDGLEKGRVALTRWGYRRCEVITWCLASVASDLSKATPMTGGGTGGGIFASSAVHLLVGIRGTIKRSQDANFVHCNIDTDVLFWEGEPRESASLRAHGLPRPIDLRLKPPELYTIIENFCLGTRRVELFGTNRNLRRGWLTIGLPSTLGEEAPGWDKVLSGDNAGALCAQSKHDGPPQEYVRERYNSHFKVDPVACPLSMRSNVVPHNELVEQLRPRTPPPQQQRRKAPSSADVNASILDMTLAVISPLPGSNPSMSAAQSLPRGLGVAYQSQHDRTQACSYVLHPSPVGNRSLPLPMAVPCGLASSMKSPTAGLGAGGPVTVSLQSGSDRLSGPQKSAVGLGMATMGELGASTMQPMTQDRRDSGGDGGGGRGRGSRRNRSDQGSGGSTRAPFEEVRGGDSKGS